MSRILYSLTVIELSTPGLEATTYELIASVSNAGMSLSTIFATQLLNVVHASGCTEDDDSENDITTFNSTSSCSSSTSVDLTSVDSYKDSNGPIRFTKYTLLLSKWITLSFFSSYLPSLLSSLLYILISILLTLISFLSLQLVSRLSRHLSLHHSYQKIVNNVMNGLFKENIGNIKNKEQS